MDIVGLVKKSYADYGTMLKDSWYTVITEEMHYTWTWTYWILACAFIISVYCMRYVRLKRIREKEENEQFTSSNLLKRSYAVSQQRFRKRDKMMFYGRRMLRKVKTISGQAYSGQGKKRRAVVRFARNLLLRKDATPPQRHVIEPPAEYLEEASDGSGRVPPDALYLLQSIRIFGHFDTPVFLKLCKHTEILDLSAGESLIKVGDADDSVYIVQTGQVNVFLNNLDGTSITLKVVRQGESVTSLLSFIDVLVGNTSQYKTVTARAMEASLVIRLPMFAFKEVFSEYPGLLVRVVQAIMVRLQRVTITALHNYLGLSTEYIQVQCSSQRKKTTAQMKSCSPGHRRIPSDQGQTHSLVGDLKTDPLVDGSDGALLVSARNSNFPIRSLVVDDAKSDVQFDSSDILHNNSASTSIMSSDSVEYAVLKASAVEGFAQELGLNDTERSIVEKFIVIKEVKSTNIIIRQGVLEDVLLIFVISGGLTLAQCPQTGLPTEEESKKPLEKGENHSINIHPGDMIGGLAVLTGESSLYTIRAKHFSRVGLLTKDVIYEIISHRPSMVLDIANSVVKQLSPLVRQCDFALDWNFIESGRAVYRQGESSDSTYIVLNGRLRSVVTHPNSKKEIVGEYGKGDLIGIIEMIAETPRTTTVMAVRDSELAKLPEGLFNAIKIKYPIVVTQLISLLSHRILGSMQSFGSLASSRFPSVPLDTNQPVQHRFSTVAILATSDEVPVLAFTYELYHSLSAIGSTVRLTSDIIRDTLGSNVMEHSSEYRLTSWLGQQEDRHNITLYQCDNDIGQWTQRCLRQADVILIVALGSQSPTIGRLEKEIDRLAIRTTKELVLLHSQSSDSCPTNTIGWLNMRSWVSRHHHIQCPNSIFNRRTPGRIHETYDKRMNSKPYIHSDFSRLARWLTGNSVGLVLGGGGARGAAHVGMLKAIQEAGIPIDMVGGVSIGAFMGALWCMEKNITPMTQKAREWCKKMTQWGRQLRDLTYPITSMFSGRHFNQTIRGTFGDICIEDLWIPFFTLTTDISASCARVHTHGSTWRYVRSSMSLSGYMPPLCDPKDGHLLLDGGYVNNLPGMLWRYVRASMSVAGIFPPMIDNRDGHLLLDGCYTNNVPADVMRSQGAAHIIAIDVGSQDDTDLTDYGDDLSGWWLLYKRWNPFTSPVKVPNLPDIQSRLAYVSCVRQLEEVKKSDYCEYIRPPIDKYKTLAFGSFDEIKTVGFEHGKICFEEMDKNGRLSRFNAWSVQSMPKKETHSLNEYTFVDLAQLVCKVPETYPERVYSSSEEDYYDGYASEPSSKPSLKRSLQALRPAGGSLSLSENEMDSDDLEIPMPFNTLQANLVVRGDRK